MREKTLYQKAMKEIEPYRRFGGVGIGLGLIGIIGGWAHAYQGAAKAVEQMRDGSPNGPIQGEANDTLSELVGNGKTHYGDMPGTTLSQDEIAGADEMYEGMHNVEFGLLMTLFGAGVATKSTRILMTGAYLANTGVAEFSGKGVSEHITDFILKQMIG